MSNAIASNAIIPGLGLALAAGGASSRFGDGSKLFAELGGMPLFLWPLRTLSEILEPGMAVLAVPEEEIPKFEEALKWQLPELKVKIVPGGPTRTHSVLCALKALPSNASIAAVHDAARPFIKAETLAACVEACRNFGGAVAAKRVTDTIKEAGPDGMVTRTLDRSFLWAMETPQVFPREVLQSACEQAIAEGIHLTDDAAAVERFFKTRVKLVENPHYNPKITYQIDLDLAKSQLHRLSSL